MGISNMYLLDEEDNPVRYNTSFEILDSFFIRRLRIYEQRKAYFIQKLEEEKITLQHKVRFIQAVRNKEINLVDCEIDDIYTIMDRLQIPRDIYNNAHVRVLSKNDISSLTQQIVNKQTEKEQLEQITPQQLWLNDLQELENAYLRMLSDSKKDKSKKDGKVARRA
jgi:DNA topoisomerase-2